MGSLLLVTNDGDEMIIQFANGLHNGHGPPQAGIIRRWILRAGRKSIARVTAERKMRPQYWW